MKNKEQHLTGIRQTITYKAFDRGPEDTAKAVTDLIDKAYILIERNDEMPTITFGSLDDAFAGEGFARTKHLTENVYNGDYKKIRDLGLQYLVMADYVENKVIKAQTEKAAMRRYRVFKELFPENETTLEAFEWSSLHEFERMVIDKMVLLNMELDKDF